MKTKILVEFEPKDASPLEVINTLDEKMQQNLEEGKISEYSFAEQHEDAGLIRISSSLLVARNDKPQEPPQGNPT